MACPCFYPIHRSALTPGKIVPLGGLWSGVCRALPDREFTPNPATQQQLCNFGYAREKCPHVPTAHPDAVRFCISNDRDGIVSIYWVMEKDHLPFAHGPLEYSRAESGFYPPHPDSIVARQADAYLSGYLEQKEHRS